MLAWIRVEESVERLAIVVESARRQARSMSSSCGQRFNQPRSSDPTRRFRPENNKGPHRCEPKSLIYMVPAPGIEPVNY
ncbi:hypothetical protein [Geopseudomonas aromaticivorans]